MQDPRIYLALRGKVYDVSSRPDLYGASHKGGYSFVAGRDATRALTKMSLKAEDAGRDDIGDLLASPLAELHVKALKEWVEKFDKTYSVVGSYCKQPEVGTAPVKSKPPPPALPPPVPQVAASIPAMRPAGTPELLCEKPRIYRVRGFLTPGECRALRRMATGTTNKGMIFKEAKIRCGLRAGDEKWDAQERELLSAVEARLGELMGCEPHEDEVDLVGTLTPPCKADADDRRCHLGLHVDTNGGRQWRYATAICYLSSVSGGGSTVFPVAQPLGAAAPMEDEELELVDAAQRMLDANIDHTDRVLVCGEQPQLRADAETMVGAGEAGSGLCVNATEGDVAIFWTRCVDGCIDPYSWHGGESVACGGQPKWTLQKFKEVPLAARVGPAELAEFVARTRRQLAQRLGAH